MTRDNEILKEGNRIICEYFGKPDIDQLHSFKFGVNWADKHPKCPWIKLSERKPQPKMRVIFLDNTGKAHFGSGLISNDGAVIVGADGESMPILTHWMPIPKLTKGE